MKIFFYSTLLLTVPLLSSAAPPRDFKGVVNIVLGIIDIIIPFIFMLAFITIIWGVVKSWIINVDDPSEIEKGRQLVFAGIIGLVVMSGIWGILGLLRYGIFNI